MNLSGLSCAAALFAKDICPLCAGANVPPKKQIFIKTVYQIAIKMKSKSNDIFKLFVNNISVNKSTDNILISLAAFLLCFCWLRYSGNKLWVCYTASAVVSLLSFAVLFFVLKKINQGVFASKKATTAQKNALLLLCDYSPFTDIFIKNGYTVQKICDDTFVAENKSKLLLYFLFKTLAVNKQDVINVYKKAVKQNADKIALFCLDYDASTREFLQQLPIKITVMNFADTQTFLKQNHKCVAQPAKQKRKIRESKILYFALNKSRFKYYLSSAVFLALLSVVTMYGIYNIVMASICFLLGLIALLNKKYNPQNKLNI